MSRRAEVEVFSLSFLDLICCGMAGILVLYSTAAPDVPPRRKNDLPPCILTVEFPDKMAGVEFEVEFQNGSTVLRGTSDGGRTDWMFSVNPPQAVLQFDEPLERGNTYLRVWIRDLDTAASDSGRELKEARAYYTLLDPSQGLKYIADSRVQLTLDESNRFHAVKALQ